MDLMFQGIFVIIWMYLHSCFVDTLALQQYSASWWYVLILTVVVLVMVSCLIYKLFNE